MLTAGFSIPIYNDPKGLERCLRSLRNQTVPVAEIVVVDDASDGRFCDEQNAIACRYGAWFLFCDYLGEAKRFRKCQAFNAGASLLSTDVTFYSQGDMIYPPDYVERSLVLHGRWKNLLLYPHVHHLNEEEVVLASENLPTVSCAAPHAAFAVLMNGARSFCADFGHLARFSNSFEFLGVFVDESVERKIVPCNGVGAGCIFSVRRENDVHWDNRFCSTSGMEDDVYHRAMDAGLFPALVEDMPVIHAHIGDRDVSYFDVGMEDAAAYYAGKRKSFRRGEPLPLESTEQGAS